VRASTHPRFEDLLQRAPATSWSYTLSIKYKNISRGNPAQQYIEMKTLLIGGETMSKPHVTKHFQIRQADTADAEEITRMINSAFRVVEGSFVEGDRIELKEVIDSLSSGTFLLAEEEGALVGCVYVEPRGERAYLGLLSVSPYRQQSGVGSQLMIAAENHCSTLGCRFMDIKIVHLRTELSGFYGRRGYVESGTSSFPAYVKTTQPCYFIDMTKPLDAHGEVQI
jgi:N-acetylglutamate synthase-like GNAT family acetyltransferase